jgi:thiamine pyrophosphate-dependent acetolactate synthase large subunit-like protein
MKRDDALKLITTCLPERAIVVTANGLMVRQLYHFSDRGLNFYMVGSMGLAASIGLGIAMNMPERRVVVLDGDGNLLMGLGTLPVVGHIQPHNFTHLVLDNHVYETTGGQRSVSPNTSFSSLAVSSGYKQANELNHLEDEQVIRLVLGDYFQCVGPCLLAIQVETSRLDIKNYPRVKLHPREIKQRFMGALQDG